MGNPEVRPGEENFLNNTEAQDEANMLRAKLEMDPSDGKIPAVKKREPVGYFESAGAHVDRKSNERMPTAKDYDEALRALEELKQLALEEPTGEKLINQAKRIGTKVPAEIWVRIQEALLGPGRQWESIKENHAEFIHRFDDAAYKLNQLKSGARNFETDWNDEVEKK